MKKTFVVPFLALMTALPLVGCGGSSGGGGGGGGGGEPAQPLDLGPQFNAEYYPKPEDNKVKSIVGNVPYKMKIDVAINFEGTENAWASVADEYERLCGNIVDVNLVTGLSTSAYTEKLHQEEKNPNTDWDIVQGNLMTNVDTHALNLLTSVSSKNPYAGNKIWKNFLEKEAYITDKTGSTDFCYFLNSENLSTAWFVNTAATDKAGVTNTSPKTWDELINMLDKLQQAGYKYPLGLTLNKDGIEASQFAWLLRVYGDYFYRDNYMHTTKTFNPITGEDSFVYDKTSENPEASSSFSFSINRCLTTMLDNSSEYFVGPTSERFSEFLYQIGRLAKYVKPTAYYYSFNEVRTSFMAQTDGNQGDEAPQVLLDYSGEGLAFLSAPKLKDNIDFFDYPTIVSSEVPDGTLVRDVGGNGGYLSIISYHGYEQKELNKDFLKFFLSPYGQSIYYNALSEKGGAPKGLTTVKNDLVLIPDSWKEFFKTDKISFTGLADNNSFLNYGVYRFFESTKALNKTVELWQSFLKPSGAVSINTFSMELLETYISCYADVAKDKDWPLDGYLQKHFSDPDYIKG